uniref:Uncharacterized protein n=1 Tax=viral metagenome TaxID=1070528 RepID=A0A2V0R9J9_9ZZZZ
MNEETEPSYVARRQVAIVNTILSFWNLLAYTPMSHKHHGVHVNDYRTAVAELIRQRVPTNLRALHDELVRYARLAYTMPAGASWTALVNTNPHPRFRTRTMNRDLNSALTSLLVNFLPGEEVLIGTTAWIDDWERLFPFALFEAYGVLRELGIDDLHSLEVISSIFGNRRHSIPVAGLLQ